MDATAREPVFWVMILVDCNVSQSKQEEPVAGATERANGKEAAAHWICRHGEARAAKRVARRPGFSVPVRLVSLDVDAVDMASTMGSFG